MEAVPPTDLDLHAIAELAAAFGDVPPPWAKFPRVHPCDGHWRMGAGEHYASLLIAWRGSLAWSTDERIAYIRRWDPPYSWLEWVAWFIWPDEVADDQVECTDSQFERLEALGFGSHADWRRCFEVEPDSYPLSDDVSRRWIEASARR